MLRIRRTLQSLGRTTIAVLASVALASQSGAAQVPGTYRLTICTSACSAADSGVVRGFLVLFPDSVALGTLSPALRDSLARDSRWLLRGRVSRVATACFTLATGPAYVDGRGLYAGIIRRGLTMWEQAGAGMRVRLYQSPDAAYVLDGTLSGQEYTGRGEQRNCCGGPTPSTFFRAVRIREPDITACI